MATKSVVVRLPRDLWAQLQARSGAAGRGVPTQPRTQSDDSESVSVTLRIETSLHTAFKVAVAAKETSMQAVLVAGVEGYLATHQGDRDPLQTVLGKVVADYVAR